MHKAGMQMLVSHRVIGVNRSSVLYIAQDFILQRLSLDVRHYRSADLAKLAIKHPLDNSLPFKLLSKLVNHYAAVLVHVLHLAADKSFIGLNFASRSAADLATAKLPSLEDFANPLKHKPRRLLGNTKIAGQFVTGDAILAIRKHPNCRHPLIQPKRRILKDRFYFDGELLLAGIAEPDSPRLDKRMLLGSAPRAEDVAIRPAKFNRVVKCPLRIGKVNNRLLEGDRRLHG
jgi:hypothetical protein